MRRLKFLEQDIPNKRSLNLKDLGINFVKIVHFITENIVSLAIKSNNSAFAYIEGSINFSLFAVYCFV